MQALAVMEQDQVVDLDRTTAITAAELSTRLRLPLADSVMLATAQRHGAILWTQDTDFEGLEGVRYFARR